MKLYLIAERSTAKADQVPGVKCDTALLSVESDFDDEESAWDWIKGMLVVPGVWHCHMRRGSAIGKMLGNRTYEVAKQRTEV